jgi:predicted metal-dependent hydrolase
MSARRHNDIAYELVRSRRKTADIVIERDGRLLVRAPRAIPDERIEDIVESKRYWIYKNLAAWRDLNATRVLREYRNGEGFLYLGRSYRLLLVADQGELLLLKDGRFCLRRDLVDRGEIAAAKAAFRDYYSARGSERITQRVDYYAPKVGVVPRSVNVPRARQPLGLVLAQAQPRLSLEVHDGPADDHRLHRRARAVSLPPLESHGRLLERSGQGHHRLP